MADFMALKNGTGKQALQFTWYSQWGRTLVSVGAGLICLAVTELMHYLLVADIGRRRERWLAEGLAAVAVSALTARLVALLRRQHEATLARLQVISEINHHIRNALVPISLSPGMTDDRQALQMISSGLERIDWALREILPRQQPLSEEARSRLMFYAASKPFIQIIQTTRQVQPHSAGGLTTGDCQ